MFKKLIFKTTQENSFLNEATITALRVAAGLLMALLHGAGKFPPSEQLIGGVGALGFPSPTVFAWLATIAELVGGIFIAIGFLTRPAAFMLFITMAVAVFGKHATDALNVKELAVLYMFFALLFLARGAGRWSIDRFIK